MQSLTELNGRSATLLSVIDRRLATVNFDRLVANNQSITISSTNYAQLPVGIEIEEIINYEIANCQVTFTIKSPSGNPLTGSTLSWAAIPNGITLSQVGQAYTLSGFSKISQWNQIKRPSWTLPANYTSKTPFYVKVEISYFDQGANFTKIKTYNVYDPRYYYDVKLDSAFSYAATAIKNRPFTASMSAISTMRVRYDVELLSVFSLEAAALDVKFGVANWSAVSSLNSTVEVLPPVSNTSTLRLYVANKENQIFSSNTPQILDSRSGTYTVVLTCTGAQFGLTTASSSASLTLTGSKETINSQIAAIYFYPDWNQLGNLSVTWTQKYNGTTYAVRTIPVNYGSNNTDVKRVNFTTVGTHTYNPTYIEKKYCRLVRAMIGGGGSADSLSGGNSGTFTVNADDTPLNNYTFTVGAAGQNTTASYTGGSVVAAGGTTQTGTTTYTFSNYIGAGVSPNNIIFTKGWGGTNGNGNWGSADKDGEVSTGLSSVQSGNTIKNYRTEYAGNGGSAVQWFDYYIGRGGNGRVNVPGYPVTRSYNGYNYEFYTTGISGSTQSINTWGQGGDAPGGTGYPGGVFLYISRRLNSSGL